jgi:hypothetical protein
MPLPLLGRALASPAPDERSAEMVLMAGNTFRIGSDRITRRKRRFAG